MKYIKSINEISGYDRWKTQSPYDNEKECISDGYLDADITFNVDKRVDSDAIDATKVYVFYRAVDDFLRKYFKKAGLKMTAVSPFATKDASYRDWVEKGDQTYSIGSMAWKITGDFDDVEASNVEETVFKLLPSEKELQAIIKRHSWIDKKIWIENIDSEISNNCDDDY